MTKQSLEVIDVGSWEGSISSSLQNHAVQSLESGKILYFPFLPFTLNSNETIFLSPEKLHPKAKNISYDFQRDFLGKTLCTLDEALFLKAMMRRYALCSLKLLETLIPHYSLSLIQARTSLRPVEIFGRKTSYKKDDTRLHVDSFPSNPVKGRRILRVFTNINHEGKSRVWRTGEPFADVVRKIAPRVSHPFPGVAQLLKLLGITKDLRTPYDHYMMQIHDTMKSDVEYQRTVPQEEVHFAPGSSWIVYTDQVSHAAMSGQHVLEQTYYLPSNGLKNPNTSPLAVLEEYFKKPLL